MDELIHEVAYEAVKNSPLWNSLPSNAAIDIEADELAEALQNFIEGWLKGRIKEVSQWAT
jgi:hypothetical protein